MAGGVFCLCGLVFLGCGCGRGGSGGFGAAGEAGLCVVSVLPQTQGVSGHVCYGRSLSDAGAGEAARAVCAIGPGRSAS